MTLKKDPNKAWLKRKVEHYKSQGDTEMAQRFITTYTPYIPDLTEAEAAELLEPPKRVGRPPQKKEDPKKVKGD